MAPDDPDPDPQPDWSDVVFDESFVGAAAVTEPSAAERLARADRSRREDRERAWEAKLVAAEQSATAHARTTRRRRRRQGVVAVMSSVALVAMGLTLDRVAPRGGTVAETSRWEGTTVSFADSIGGDRPTPSPADSLEPLGTAPVVETPDPAHSFIGAVPGADPARYDPCRPIRYVVNSSHAIDGGEALLAAALARVQGATGLRFEPDEVRGGISDEIPTSDRPAFQPTRYPDQWAPVLIAWVSDNDSTLLEGDVAGFAGSAAIDVPNGEGDLVSTYITGMVALDGPQLAEIAARSGSVVAGSVILHELAHLVGLDHVDDPTQIMNPTGSAEVSDFAAGDLTGLAELGRGDCIPAL